MGKPREIRQCSECGRPLSTAGTIYLGLCHEHIELPLPRPQHEDAASARLSDSEAPDE